MSRFWQVWCAALVLACSSALAVTTTNTAEASADRTDAVTAEPFAYQPIEVERINLPKGVTSAGWPVFTNDGRHLLFFSTGSGGSGGSTGKGATAQLWIVGLDGSHPHCLSCGVPGVPTSQGEGEITPFSDGKRVFFGSFHQPGASHYGVLSCTPSVVHCRHSRILPVDFTAAEKSVVPPGGASAAPQTNLGGTYGAKLAPDGKHIGYSDIRSDSLEVMVVATLRRSATTYAVTNPRVINPVGPSSASDTDIDHWSDGGSLYEIKTFTHGGADATYVQVGGPGLQNPDVWSVNLATGVRTRLTSNADYDEDNAVSPDGSLLALWSNRTMHMTDWLGGLMPVRDFIDAPSALLALGLSSSNKRCHGPMWILPGTGDQGGALLGQPIVYDEVPHVFVTNNLVGAAQWSPDGTKLALNTTNGAHGTGYPRHAPFLLVAHFTALHPTTPIPTVSSTPGPWTTTPSDYHPSLGHVGTVVLDGPGGGTVSLTFSGVAIALAGSWSATYDHYSDNGTDFVDGSVSIENDSKAKTYSSHLTLTGAHEGSTDIDLDFNANDIGHGTVTYDGHTVSGPQPSQLGSGPCTDLQPKKPGMSVETSSLGDGSYRLTVTVAMPGAGADEGTVTRTPVDHATVTIGGTAVHTDHLGVATIPAGTGQHEFTVRAGNTLRPYVGQL